MVFFDVGGTLVGERVNPASEIVGALQRLGVGAAAEVMASAVGAMALAYWAGVYAPASAEGERAFWRALATTGLNRIPGAATPARIQALADLLEDYPPWYAPQDGMVDLLRRLRAQGRPVGVISNWPPSLPRLLEYHDLGPFPVIACSGPLRVAKPDPTIFHWALARADVRPSDAWYVGNEPTTDYHPAEGVGMRAVLWDPPGRYAESRLRRAGSAEELWGLLADP